MLCVSCMVMLLLFRFSCFRCWLGLFGHLSFGGAERDMDVLHFPRFWVLYYYFRRSFMRCSMSCLGECSIMSLYSMLPNQSPEPTAVGVCSSAVAVRVASRRWLSFLRDRK